MNTSPTIRKHRLTRIDDILPTLDRLLEQQADGPHLAFYVGGGRLADDMARARTTLGNQVSAARERLSGEEDAGNDGAKLLDECDGLLDDADFWRQRNDGIAIFVSRLGTDVLCTGTGLPDRWTYSSSFYLKPLLAAASQANAYWLLTLSQKQVRLHRGSSLGFREVACEGLALDLRDALDRRGLGPDSAPVVAAESRKPVEKQHLQLFLEVVEEAVSARTAGSGLPLLVAGVAEYEPLYRAVNSYRHISDAYMQGNVDDLDGDELHRRASELLKRDFKESSVRQLRRYKEVSETGAALDRLDLILTAASRGQVKSLFVPGDEDLWGTYDPVEGRIDRAGSCDMSNTDLYELAARQTLATGGEVFFMDAVALPRDRKALALLRWTSGDGELEHGGGAPPQELEDGNKTLDYLS